MSSIVIFLICLEALNFLYKSPKTPTVTTLDNNTPQKLKELIPFTICYLFEFINLSKFYIWKAKYFN